MGCGATKSLNTKLSAQQAKIDTLMNLTLSLQEQIRSVQTQKDHSAGLPNSATLAKNDISTLKAMLDKRFDKISRKMKAIETAIDENTPDLVWNKFYAPEQPSISFDQRNDKMNKELAIWDDLLNDSITIRQEAIPGAKIHGISNRNGKGNTLRDGRNSPRESDMVVDDDEVKRNAIK